MILPYTPHILQNGHSLDTGFLVAKNLAVTCVLEVIPASETAQVQFTERDENTLTRVGPEYCCGQGHNDIAFLRLKSIAEIISPRRLDAGTPFPS